MNMERVKVSKFDPAWMSTGDEEYGLLMMMEGGEKKGGVFHKVADTRDGKVVITRPDLLKYCPHDLTDFGDAWRTPIPQVNNK